MPLPAPRSRWERITAAPVPLWAVGLIVILGLLVTTIYGSILLKANRYGALGDAARALAAVPGTIQGAAEAAFTRPSLKGLPPLPAGLARAPGFTDPGYVLVTAYSETHGRRVIRLIRLADGALVREYATDLTAAHARSRIRSAIVDLARDKNPARYFPMHPLLMEDGGLVLHDTSPLVRTDVCGRVRWMIDGIFHHAVERAPDGTLWAAMRAPRSSRPGTAGLARAGTTIAMRLLHAADDLASLTYRDLPFPLAPNLWAGASQRWRRDLPAAERGHGDGLTHNLDSPEAIEEVFWRLHEHERYCTDIGLIPHAPLAATGTAFVAYVRLICRRYGRDRYLSKNNANILRLPALVALFPDARLVHPFREPIAQASSLLAQHRRAVVLAEQDRFRGKFMHWLGHHEFGAHIRPFLLPADAVVPNDPHLPDYWLQTWINVHRHLLDQPEPVARRQLFLDHDWLLTRDPALATKLQERLSLPRALPLDLLHTPRAPRRTPPFSPALVAEARDIHHALIARAAT